jgi:hypothetical protein
MFAPVRSASWLSAWSVQASTESSGKIRGRSGDSIDHVGLERVICELLLRYRKLNVTRVDVGGFRADAGRFYFLVGSFGVQERGCGASELLPGM